MNEDGSDVVAGLWNGDDPIGSGVLTYAEGQASLAAARRAKRLSPSQYSLALADFEARASELIWIDIDERLARLAGEQAEAHGLRGYDSVHLATALELHDEVAMITWDAELRSAAERVGLPVAAADA
jgi:predicted nucleic acid-binding protein